jgi:hypothetical protein
MKKHLCNYEHVLVMAANCTFHVILSTFHVILSEAKDLQTKPAGDAV